MSGVLDFLLDLILDWDEIPSYEYLVDVEEPQRTVEDVTRMVIEEPSKDGVGVLKVHSREEVAVRRILTQDRLSYEEYQERGEPTRGEIAFERYSTYR